MESNSMILYNADIITLDSTLPRAEWIYIKEGYIADIGLGEGYKRYANLYPSYNAGGSCIIPGFFDSHVHLVQSGLNKLACNMSSCTSVKEILDVLKNAKSEITEWGQIIRCIGIEEIKLEEKRMPTRWELDSVITDNIVWISSVEYHVSVFNSLGFRLLNLPFNLEGIERDERGLPTGVLTGKANFLARKKMLGIISDKTRDEGIKIVLDEAIKNGVTTINAMEGGFLFHDRDAEFINKNLTAFPVDIELFYQTTDVEKVNNIGLNKIGGCIFLDGSFGARTAAITLPYEDMKNSNGNLFFSDYEIENFIDESISKGFYTTVHAIGDRAIGQILAAYRKVSEKHPYSRGRMRIEHFEIPSIEQIKCAAELGVILSMQPTYEHYWGGEKGMYEVRLGRARTEQTNPFSTIISHGGIIAGGSDSDVTPINPMLGIYSAISHPNKSERISIFEALKMFTINGAIAIGQEYIKGKLQIGYLGDLCILNKNILNGDESSFNDISVVGTIKTGKIIYASRESEIWGDEID